jgi:predicted CoA-substrate-specific enzyme activase
MIHMLGLDAGSISVKAAFLDENGQILQTLYKRHKGRPVETALNIFKEGTYNGIAISITGSAGKLIASALGIEAINEVVAQSYAVKKLYPHIRSIIEMGGEDSKLILMEHGKVKEFSMNSVCAAGTGSFLDQQAERLKLTIEELGEMALKSKNPPRIAGRCSVFAKSDMIHLQQIATPVEDIVAGLCFAVARNFKGSICKNLTLPEPIGFQGGVAANKGVVRAFREIFQIDTLFVPEHFALMGAIGSALKHFDEGITTPLDIEKLKDFISQSHSDNEGLNPLCSDKEKFLSRHQIAVPAQIPTNGRRVSAYLGIDIGSISTNLALIDEEGRLLSKRYLMTSGRPIEAVMQGLREIGDEIGFQVDIKGVATTGSGRYMIADFVGADVVKNEITAQATAAADIDPEVDTIFEIGGQDSKYISLRDGIIVDFEMNKACAAGTGSFLEEQAEKLDISVKEQYADMAFSSQSPCALGERCTVFMENSLVARQQSGAKKDDLVAGLAYSIVQNYITKVVSSRKIGKKIFFQGGVAFNKAVVAAFEQYLGREIIVPPHHDVTGAIGMALIARQNAHETATTTRFKGFDLSRRSYELSSFECKGCSNLCEINKVNVQGENEPLFYGSRCEKYDVKRKKINVDLPDLFGERDELLEAAHKRYNEKAQDRFFKATIGLPRIFFFLDTLPFWSVLLWEMGLKVELSPRTNRQIVMKGTETVLSESCFPVKVAHGHVKYLIEKRPDAVFLPSFINLNTPKDTFASGFACPYVQTMPYMSNVAFSENGGSSVLLQPVINMRKGDEFIINELYKVFKGYGVTRQRIKEAMKKAHATQKEFITAIRARGQEVLDNLTDEKALVIIGRSYNSSDSGLNLEIPKKLRALGVLPLPIDFLPLASSQIKEIWPHMYWKSGQRILTAAEIVRNDPRLYPLYISNFSCGPDSFIYRYFKDSIGEKPYLHLEIDEHSADAGAVTRCEAFLDSIRNREEGSDYHPQRVKPVSISGAKKQRKIYIPHMSDHAYAIAGAFRSCGIEAEVMPKSDRETINLGRTYISGKECFPCAVTTGDMVKVIRQSDFDPERDAFFMPSGTGPCRFGQYNVLQRMVLDSLGYKNVPIHAPTQDSMFYKELGIAGSDFTKRSWAGIITVELLLKCLHESRPYEIHGGESESLYMSYLEKISQAVGSMNGRLQELTVQMKEDFSRIPKNDESKPLIGIMGEIFVRHNVFSNEGLVKKVEALGGEVWLAPVEEWLYYVNYIGMRHAFEKRNISDILSIFVTQLVQKKIEHKLARPLEGYLKTLHEPSTREIIKKAKPYVHESFEGETILSMGKAVDFFEKRASGIISAMPFACMPGTIVGTLLRKLKKETGIPFLSLSYDGNKDMGADIQLEAFMYQSREYMNGHGM